MPFPTIRQLAPFLFVLLAITPEVNADSIVAFGQYTSHQSGITATLLNDGRVLVAGGGSAPKTTEFYTPLTATWTAGPAMATERRQHTATLLRDGQVLVVGGSISGVPQATAELFDPIRNTWRTVGSVATARYKHTAALLPDGRVLVVGGINQTGSVFSSAEIFDPLQETFSATQSMGTSRFEHSMTVLNTGKVLVAGGRSGNYLSLSTCELYDAATGTWSATGSLPSATTTHGALALRNGKVLVAGGSNGAALNDAALYDPGLGTWSVSAPLPAPRSSATMTLLPNGKALLTGGHGGAPYQVSTQTYDSNLDQWTTGPTMNTGRAGHKTALLPDGEVLITGGAFASNAQAELYRTGSDSWTSAAPMPSALRSASACLLADGRVLVAGGNVGGNAVGTAYIFDGVGNSWTPTGSMTTPRFAHRLTVLPGGKVLASGGEGPGGSPLASAELYDPGTGTWTTTGNLATARKQHTATLLLNGSVLATGGDGASGPLASVETYDPGTGVWTAGTPLITARSQHAAVFKPDGAVIVTGGVGASGLLASTEHVTGWASSTGGSLASARKGHTISLLPSGTLLVCGGTGNSGLLTSCEKLLPTGTVWETAPPLNEARTGHTATLLPSGQVLVAGGSGAMPLATVERFDPVGSAWSAGASMSTSRADHVAVLMPDQKVLIAGGADGTTAELDTTERYDEGKGIPELDRPIVTGLPGSLPTSARLQVTGTSLLSPTGPASDGSVSHGLIQLRSLANEQSLWLTQWPFTPGTSTSLTAMQSGSFPTGPAMVTVVRDGVPSVSKILDVSPGTVTKQGDVQGPDGNVLIEGVSVVDFGPATIGGSAVRKVFRIRNVGSVRFSTAGIISDLGSLSTGFTFVPIVDEVRYLEPGTAGRIFVDFSPPKVGRLKLNWWVAESFSFYTHLFPEVTVSGTGYAANNAGKLSFATSEVQVNEEDGTVLVPITRTIGRSGTVTVKVTTTIGSAGATDFTPLNATVVTFADGEVMKQVPVTLNADALDELNETFTLTLSGPTGGATLLAPTKTTVRIIDLNDSVIPTLTLTAPAQNAIIADGAAKITGTAFDDKMVSKVQYSLNGSAFINAATALAANGLSATFTAPLTPLAGPNVVAVRSVDGRGLVSASTTRSFFYSALRPLLVTRTSVESGTLPAPFPGTSNRVVGKRYTLTATAKAGFAFSGWSMSNTPGTGLTSEARELPTISFIHQEGLQLEANFIINPFASSVVGSFTGLISPSTSQPAPAGTVEGNDTFGCFTASVTSSGSFTGTLRIDAASLPIAGKFDVGGTARFGTSRNRSTLITRGTKPALELALAIDLVTNNSTHKITGTLMRRYRSDVVAVSRIDADRAAYNGTTALPPESLVGTSSKRYTMALLARTTQSNGLGVADYPQGDGYLTGTVSKSGSVTYLGRLADHTVISASTKLSITNTWTLFAAPYGMKGSFGGKIIMDDSPAQTDSDMQGNALRWFRPYQAVQWYPFGWPEGILVDLKGAKYAAVSGSSVLPGLEASDPINGNATLTFSDGLLPAPLIKNLNISVAEAVSHAPTTDTTFSLKITRTSGLVTGTFVHPMNSQTAYQGVILQKGPGARAYGYFMSPTTKPLNYLGQSGRIDLHSR